MASPTVHEETEDLRRRILELPKGYLSVKTIKGKERYYHQWYESGKLHTRYLREDEYPEMKARIDERKELQRRLADIEDAMRLNEPYRNTVITGAGLDRMAARAEGTERRECFGALEGYLRGNDGRVCILYGLRRSGKSMMICQALAAMDDEGRSRTVYIRADGGSGINGLRMDVARLMKEGIDTFLIDEVTDADGFLQGSGFFAGVMAVQGYRVVLSGTDSLGFWVASRSGLYSKALMIHTTRVPYREHVRIMGGGLDEYIREGGVFRGSELDMETMAGRDDVAFDSIGDAETFLDVSVADNIERTLCRLDHGTRFGPLKEIHQRGLFRGALNRLAEDENHRFLLEVLNSRFVSRDLEDPAGNIDRMAGPGEPSALSDVDLEAVSSRLREILEIRDSDDGRPVFDHEGLEVMREYLDAVDVFKPMPVLDIGSGRDTSRNSICIQPGLRYVHADALISSLESDPGFAGLEEGRVGTVLDNVRDLVAGSILEETVLYDTITSLGRRYRVFKLFMREAEVDMVVYDRERRECVMVEVKHSSGRYRSHSRSLRDPEVVKALESRFHRIAGRYVLYRGEDFDGGGTVRFLNVERYLLGLPRTAEELFR